MTSTDSTTMKTWDKATADKWIADMEESQHLDKLAQKVWFNDTTGVGCFFGRALRTDEGAMEKAVVAMKLPPWLVQLSEGIFEGLPSGEAKSFPVRLLKAIPLNACIESVRHDLAIARMKGCAAKHAAWSSAYVRTGHGFEWEEARFKAWEGESALLIKLLSEIEDQ